VLPAEGAVTVITLVAPWVRNGNGSGPPRRAAPLAPAGLTKTVAATSTATAATTPSEIDQRLRM
jgi:hypothetical protein